MAATPISSFKIPPAIKARAAVRAMAEGRTLTDAVNNLLDRYGSGDIKMDDQKPADPPGDTIYFCLPSLHDGKRVLANYTVHIKRRTNPTYYVCAAHIHLAYKTLAPTAKETVTVRAIKY